MIRWQAAPLDDVPVKHRPFQGDNAGLQYEPWFGNRQRLSQR